METDCYAGALSERNSEKSLIISLNLIILHNYYKLNSSALNLQRYRQTAKSAALVLCGLTWMARNQAHATGAVLTFHGLREDGGALGVLDESLHLSVRTFRRICEFLARRYQVMPLSEMARLNQLGEKLPARAVAITFDDGYASNHDLGFPVLRDLGLPATIFLSTGFLDGTHALWFQEMDLAYQAMGRSGSELATTLAELKKLPNAELRAAVKRAVTSTQAPNTIPRAMQPMSWDDARSLQQSGLIELGGHTHTHPILARCTLEEQAYEIKTCRDRMVAELGRAPSLFAYTNGGAGDFTAETQGLLAEHGFTAAFTMMGGRYTASSVSHALPRYGSPETCLEADAMASGAFELLKKWRGGGA
jgi:peptidoglycan/xylan/chitin deacetylase (PgdA/CDA1 family)